MNSWTSKLTVSVALLTACGSLNSCRLFGGGKYSSQTEIETEVPESLNHGKPSAEPPTSKTAAYATSNGVPVSSNLIETGDPIPTPGDLAPPASAPTRTVAGGAALSSLPSEPSHDIVEIPKPDFSNVSLQNPRPPARMLTLESPAKSSSRVSAPATSSQPYTAAVVKEPAPPPATAKTTPPKTAPSIPSESEIASAPKASKAAPEPGVPLLHSGTRLSDFYANLHQPLLDQGVVENHTPATDPAAPPSDDTNIPAPPPGSGDFAAPTPQ